MNRFDEVIDRRGTGSLKHDFTESFGLPADALPLWVADMDFRAPQEVTAALRLRVEHGIFGYTDTKEEYVQAVTGWFAAHFGWEAEPEWLVKSPGVVFALSNAVRAFTGPGEAVLIQPPVYGPFAACVLSNSRKLAVNRLAYRDGRYTVDFDDFERKIVQNGVKLFLLCSPHNPVGRVWTLEELKTMGEICLRHGVRVVSDEIHCDFTYPGHTHHIFASLSEAFSANCIVCTSPSKTFNLAGLQTANILIPDEKLRQAFVREMAVTGYQELNVFGPVACMAAYRYGEDWLSECRQYLQGNLRLLREFLQKELPRIRLVEPEGTYLAWLDCSRLGLEDEALEELLSQKARLWLDGGRMFDAACGQFQRLNLASPASVLKAAMERLRKAAADFDRRSPADPGRDRSCCPDTD